MSSSNKLLQVVPSGAPPRSTSSSLTLIPGTYPLWLLLVFPTAVIRTLSLFVINPFPPRRSRRSSPIGTNLFL